MSHHLLTGKITNPLISFTARRVYLMGMASPFCTICGGLGDTEGRLSCEAFPLGIPKEVYPCGCVPHGGRGFGFTPRRGMEETAERWAELAGEESPRGASAVRQRPG